MNSIISRATISLSTALMSAALLMAAGRTASANHCHPTHTTSQKTDAPVDKVKSDAAPSDGITVPEETAKASGIKTAKAIRRKLSASIRLPARIAHDDDLYTAQAEYLAAGRVSPEKRGTTLSRTLKAAELKLRLLGYDDNDMKKLAAQGEPDESLIYPGEKIWVIADVFESDMPSIKRGMRVRVVPHGGAKAFDGTVRFVESNVDAKTRTAKARIEARAAGIDAPPAHETYAEAEIEYSSDKLLTVPLSAVIDTGKRKIIYVRESPTSYTAREIVAGAAAGGYIHVKSGIAEGEDIVTEGNFMLDSQSTLGGGQSLQWGSAEEIGDKNETKPAAAPAGKDKVPAPAPVHRH